jgi:Fe-S oxidoreductase
MRLWELLSVPRRYLVDVHRVVVRRPRRAAMHVFTAGGVVVLVACLLLAVLGMHGTDAIAVLAFGAVGVGTMLLVASRYPQRAAHLSAGRYQVFPWALAAFVGGGLWLLLSGAASTTNPSSAIAWILFAWGSFDIFAAGPWGGVMKHAVAGILHLAWHSRLERFEGDDRSATALRALDLEADRLGVHRVDDFSWRQLMSFDACVECGRCEEACPAFAAGQPLNPKRLIQDLVAGMTGVDRYSGSSHPGTVLGRAVAVRDEIVPALVAPDTLWACTTCRACVEECPMLIEHVDAIIDLRRNQVLEKGRVPSRGARVLDELRAADNSSGQAAAARLDWAVDLHLPLLRKVRTTDVLLWLGDGAFNRRNQRTLRALVTLLRAARVDFAVLGAEEVDCGDVARRLGEEAEFVRLARTNIETLARYTFNRIVTADPHVLQCLKNEYPDLGGHYTVLHHSTFLNQLILDGRLAFGGARETITYHDPCYLGRYNGEFEAPRRALAAAGFEVWEMARARRQSRCCGGGGGAAVIDVPAKRRIPDLRMDDARETRARVVSVACPNCAVMLEGCAGPRPQVMDLAELLAERLQSAV